MSTPNRSVPTGDQTPKLLGTLITFDTLAVIVVALRFVSRRIAHAKLLWDDWLLVPAMAIFAAGIVFDAGAIANGEGKHVEAVGLRDASLFLKYNYAGEILYPLLLTLIKCSILCLYLRVFGINQTFRKATYGLLAIAVAWGISVTTVATFQCRPIAAAYDLPIVHKKCINVKVYFAATSILNVLIEVGILILPLPVIWTLQLPTRKKLTISAIFLLGISTLALSITRTVAAYSLSDSDMTWDFAPLTLYSNLEIDAGLICSCLPVIPPLIHLVTDDRQASPREQFSRRQEYHSKLSNNDGKRHQKHTTDLESMVKTESWNQSLAPQHESYFGATEHNSDYMDNNTQILVTHDIEVLSDAPARS